MKEQFVVQSYREIPNPYMSKKEFVDVADTKMYILICDINNLPVGLSTETNPRQQNMKTKVAKKIQDSLLDGEFNDFYLLNRGILISASGIEFNQKNREVSISFDDNKVHGIVDGGHTYKAIIENREFAEEQQFVKIEVLVGIENIFERLAGARNTSVQVKDKSLAELENKFNMIKDGLTNEIFANNIAYKENEDLDIMIDDIISILNMFDIDRYNGTSNPVCSYSSKGKCIKNYLEHYEEFTESPSNPYNKMKTIMPEIFSLFTTLEYKIGEYYSESITDSNGKYGRTKGVEISTTKKKYKGMISNENIKYKSPKSFLYPILSAFRALVHEESGYYKFLIDPEEVLDSIGPELVRLTVERCRSLGNNPNAVGKDSNHWSQLFDKVDLYRLKNI